MLAQNKEQEGTGLLDPEWVELMKEAYDMGLTVEEVRKFLSQDIGLVSA